MRSTSSACRALAILLSAILAVGGGMIPCARADGEPEPCLLLKVTSRGIPVRVAREAMAPLPGLLEERLRIRWVVPVPGTGKAVTIEEEASYPEPDSVALGEVTRRLEEANRRMEEMETAEAARLLDEAEARSRKVRFGGVIRPYLAEIFFRQGVLFLWNGEEDRCIERFARSRALRQDFSPEPALYSPSVREAWERSRDRPSGPAEILVQSLPPGGGIFLEDQQVGVTPGRIRVSRAGPVRIRVEREGYRSGEKITQWLPGDTGMVEFSLERDPDSDVLSMLAADPEGIRTGRALAEMGTRAGAFRVAVLVYDVPRGGKPVLRVISLDPGNQTAELLGTVECPEGERSAERVAERTANILAKAGWPTKTALRNRKPAWYDTWWFWTVVVAVAAGVVAAGAGGGGSGSGGSTGTIGVTF
jgi:PEGA domain